MASGAGRSADFGTPGAEARADGYGRSPMLATPVTKRAGTGASPTKRAARRVAAEIESTQTVPQIDDPTLVVEVHKLYAQSRKDQEHFDALTDATNQHASRIDDVKMDIGGLASDLKSVAADVLRNDNQLKENLKKLEELVTGLGNRESEFKGNLKKLEGGDRAGRGNPEQTWITGRNGYGRGIRERPICSGHQSKAGTRQARVDDPGHTGKCGPQPLGRATIVHDGHG